jgi:hypothetical protein
LNLHSFLDSRSLDIGLSASVSSPLFTSLTALLSTCTRLHVDVLWYDPEEEDNYAVSPSFWRYAKRIKAEEAAARVEKAVERK